MDEKDKDIKKVLATIVTKKGSSPRAAGTKCWFTRMEELWEPSAEGCLEADIIQRSLRLMSRESLPLVLHHADMTGKDAEDEGMVCGGMVDVLLEVL